MEDNWNKHSLLEDENRINFKKKLLESRRKRNFSQQQFCKAIHIENRVTVSNHENINSTVLPDLSRFVQYCDYYEVKPDYLLGFDDEDRGTTSSISRALNLSNGTVETIRNSSTASYLIEELISSGYIDSIDTQINWLVMYKRLEDVILTAFTERFISILERIFSNYYSTTFPMDYSEENFAKYLLRNGLFSHVSLPEEFVDKYFLTEASNNLYHLHNDFDCLDNNKKYECLTEIIAMHSYDYFMCKPHIKQLKERMTGQLMSMLDDIVASKLD